MEIDTNGQSKNCDFQYFEKLKLNFKYDIPKI